MQTSRLHRPQRRRGFTLIEVLTVIAILSILMAFLLPAVMRAGSNAKVVQVKTEIGNLAAAIATFKQEFGIEPPSSITLYETGTAWASDPNSRALISRMWQQYDFAGNYNLNPNTGTSDTDTSDTITLNGAECLVFFLGGVRDSSGQLSGFSRNPAMPFSATTGNRLNSFYQFDPSRLIDSDNDGFFEYRDPLNATNVAPYVYFSSNDGSGYTVDTSGTDWVNADNSSFMQRAYYQSVTGDAAANAATSKPFNPSGYQIISAGFDGQLGPGGLYAPTGSSKLPAWGTTPVRTVANRLVENDNITNFSNGQLAP